MNYRILKLFAISILITSCGVLDRGADEVVDLEPIPEETTQVARHTESFQDETLCDHYLKQWLENDKNELADRFLETIEENKILKDNFTSQQISNELLEKKYLILCKKTFLFYLRNYQILNKKRLKLKKLKKNQDVRVFTILSLDWASAPRAGNLEIH